MSTLKRIPIKYVRDRAKSRYIKDSNCFVCGVGGSLDLHHPFTVDVLFENWIKQNKIKIESAEDIIAVRDDFIGQHTHELYEYTVTLCNPCHKRLHSIYGQRPPLSTAPKQMRWLKLQRDKRLNKEE